MSTPPPAPPSRWQRFAAGTVRAFHAYGTWLVGISWKRFFVLSILLLIVSGILQDLPPFSWQMTERVIVKRAPKAKPSVPQPQEGASAPTAGADAHAGRRSVTIAIDENGVRITPRAAGSPASAASGADADGADAAGAVGPAVRISRDGVNIKLPPGAASEEVVRAVEEAKREVVAAMADADAAAEDAGPHIRIRAVRFGEFLPSLAFLLIFSSAILKISYKRTVQAEVQAAAAQESADAESLKRQVVEARMAAMQAQVEPHFLFNTLASIDHLIETDSARASQMQKNLIALLRAAMPTMRETEGHSGAARDLGRELAVVRPYLEILKMRMEERLATEIRVPDGLLSAEFPPMMLQSLVENAIKHGLEPKPEGGRLDVSAEIAHGKLVVTVADTGVGFGKGATAGSGIGLANIRERLALLYGNRASLAIAENQPSGTVVTITVPYTARPAEEQSA